MIGVIILHYAHVQSVPYTGRLYTALAPLFNYQEQEREALITIALRLNRAVQPYDEAISDLITTLSKRGPAFKAELPLPQEKSLYKDTKSVARRGAGLIAPG